MKRNNNNNNNNNNNPVLQVEIFRVVISLLYHCKVICKSNAVKIKISFQIQVDICSLGRFYLIGVWDMPFAFRAEIWL